jgi:glycosyltransferase involved in cell wall biosynthesis
MALILMHSHPTDADLSQPSSRHPEVARSPYRKTMKVLLVGNYEFDGSRSMKIWAEALLRELPQFGIDVQLIAPKPLLGRLKPSSSGFGKWLGYCDRFLIFPQVLRAAASQADIVHICDHGNAMYALRLKGKPVVVTCHDMLAVRGALGEVPEMKPSPFGGYLQRWICRGVRDADLVACVSRFTYDDVSRILDQNKNLRVILNALNYPFQPISPSEAQLRLTGIEGINRPFILHVGSSHKRKNREGVLRVFARVARELDINVVFAGEALTRDQLDLARDLHVENRVVQISKPNVKVIEALYNRAAALFFPSRYEGFGWPSIEAQACGCPVVGSSIPPLVEAVGQSALLHALDDEQGMAYSIRRLVTDSGLCDDLRRRGLENVRMRFQTARMMEEYISLYLNLVAQNECSKTSRN